MHHREYVRATGINLLFTFCIYLYYPILAPYIKSMGLDDFQTALVFSILPLVMIFSSPIMGRLADNVGRIRVIILGLILEIIAMILYIVSVNISLIIIARVLDAVAIAGVILVAIAKIEDSLSEKERGKYAGWSLSLAQIGAIIGPIVGGLMADKLFVRAPFMLTAVILLVMAFMLASKTSKLKKKVERKNFNWLAEIKHFLSIKELRGMAILGVVMHASIPATQVFLPLFIIERLGLSYTYVGIAIFFFGVMHLFQFYFGSLSNKYGRATMTMFGCFLFAFFMFLMSTAHSYWLLLVILLCASAGTAIWNVSAWTLMSGIGEKLNREGEIVGSYMSIAKTGGFISFIFSGLIVQVFSIEVLFMFNAFLIAIGLLFAARFFDRKNILSEKVSKHL